LTVSVFVVSPGLKVTVGQQTNWKSEKEAVLVEVCQANEMGTTAADERVTVKFIGVVPLFPSTTCASAMLIWGGGSSSKMEMVVLEGVPSVAPPVGLESMNVNDSVPSKTVSCKSGMEMFFDV